MSSPAAALDPETLHPSLWKASQLARGHAQCVDTGHPALSMQLPGGGWPVGTLIDLLVQQAGIGELRLLAPALYKVAARRIALLQPPHPPQALALAGAGLPLSSLLWLRAERTADQMWAAEQVLRSGTCGALLFWQSAPIRGEHLRRLHLAAQAGDTLFFMMRTQYAMNDAAPAPLRLSLSPAPGGIKIGFVKRRGPQVEEPLVVPLQTGPARHGQPRHAAPEVPVPLPAVARAAAARVPAAVR